MLKVKKVSIVSLIALMCLLIAPFHVYADTISQANIKGANFECIDITPIESSEVNMYQNIYQRAIYTFHFQAVLDQSYYGYVTGRFQGTYQTYDPNTQSGVLTKTADSYNRSFYVCGQTIDYYMQTQGWIEVNQLNNYTITYATQTFTYSGSNVVPFGYQNSLDEIIDDIEAMQIEQQNISSYLYDSDEGTIIEQVMTTNELIQQAGQMFFTMMLYTEEIMLDVGILKKLRQYDIPIYSYGLVLASFKYFEQYSVTTNDYISYGQYPIFKIPAGTNIQGFSRIWLPAGYNGYFIYGSTGNLGANNTVYNLRSPQTFTRTNYSLYNMYYENEVFEFRNIKITMGSSAGTVVLDINNTTNNDLYFIPIMYIYPSNYQFPIDVALQYNLPNSLVTDVAIIADGTQQSNNSSDTLSDSKDDMQESFNDMFEYESDFNNDMNTALQDINVQFDVGNQLGSKFLASADWVRTQFNALTNNTPIGTVISFSLILGIAMLLVGKYL